MRLASEVLTKWVVNPDDNANWPAVALDYPIHSYRDATNQPGENLHPDPNLCCVYIVCDETVLDQIAADTEFMVLWSQELPEVEI